MIDEVKMPQLGESVTEGTIQKWLVKEGDWVEEYAPLCEVSTDKVNAEIPSTIRGRVVKLLIPEGETVEVGTVICQLEGEMDSSQVASLPNQSAKGRYSPAVLRLAAEHQLDLSQIQGTGQGGRITRKDVLQYIAQKEQQKEQHDETPITTRMGEQLPSSPPSSSLPREAWPGPEAHLSATGQQDLELPITAVRRTIAHRMVASKQEIPHAWTMVEVDVTNLVQIREHHKEAFYQRNGFPLTFLPFFMKAVVEGLKKYPLLNGEWRADHILQKGEINLSVAIATEDALYVPVIQQADEKSIYGLAKSLHDLATRTRAGKLTLADMEGGSFTVNNTGSFGSILSMPIINAPQAAILSIEAIVKRPVVIDEMIAIRSMVNLCLSLDHRVLDGLICGKFLQEIKRQLESMEVETTTIY